MRKFTSLTTKYVFLSLLLLAYLSGYVIAGFVFTQHMKGAARRLNLAGGERMLMLSITTRLHIYLGRAGDAGELIHAEKVEERMAEYEDVLFGLRDGSDGIDLAPIEKQDKESHSQLIALIALWQDIQKPVLLGILKEPTRKTGGLCIQCHAVVRDNLPKIEGLVKSLERHNERKIRQFDLLRLYALGLLFAVAVFIFLFVKKGLIRPVKELQGAVSEIERGNFDLTVEARSNDEIGALAGSFNAMSRELKRAFEENVRHSQELLALADASNVILTAVTTAGELYEAICDIAVRKFGLRMAWLGFIEEGGYDVKPAARSGFDDGYLASVKVTWDDSPTGMGPTGTAIKTKKPQLINDIRENHRYSPWREAALQKGFRSSMAIPMITSEGGIMGAINFYSSEEGFFTKDRAEVFRVFANQAATAVENARLVEGLEEKIARRTQELADANLELQTINRELEMQRMEAEGAKLIAESADKAKSEFLANMSHELRTPLNSIMGFSEMMARGMTGELTPKQKEYLGDIHESGSLLLLLINDILDLSKVEAGKMELEYTDMAVRETVERVLVLFKEKTIKHGMKIITEIDEGIGAVQADERRIRQVLLNLVSNAVKFSSEGGSVRISARLTRDEGRGMRDEKDESSIEISVSNSGPGIKAEDIPKLFKPFQQLDSGYEKKHQGTGLGLALCKRIVELHGGRIWVESEVDKATKFTFVIPVRPLKNS